MSLFADQVSLLRILIAFPFVILIVVFVHELGHFLVGRWCGVQIDVFSLGFGKEIVGYTDRLGTRWRLAAIPLGGYVKFHGDVNAASAQTEAALAGMPAAERARTFMAQSVAKRAAIVVAGPVANIILALAIFTGSYYIQGRMILLPRVGAVIPGSAASQAGFAPGDLVLSVEGRPIASFADMQRIVSAGGGELTFEVTRGGTTQTLKATPREEEESGPFGKHRTFLIGLRASNDPADVRSEPLTLGQSMAASAEQTWTVVDNTGRYLGSVLVGRGSTDQMSGPIGIARISGEVAKLGIGALLNLAALLSISIGLINLVPIPLLDGGHLLYFAYEAVRGRPMSEKAQDFGFRVGLAIVSMLMILATYNDLSHLRSWPG